MSFSSSQPLKQQIQDAIDPLPPNLLPLLLNLIHLLRSHYPTPTPPQPSPTSDAWDLLQQMAGTVKLKSPKVDCLEPETLILLWTPE